MLYLAKGDLFGVPLPVFVWIAVCAGVTFLLRRTPMGRFVYAIGNRQAAVYLSGVNDRLVLVASSRSAAGRARPGCSSPDIPRRPSRRWETVISCLRSRRSSEAPTSLGGSGRLSGTFAGTVLIVCFRLSVMQMPEAGRHEIIYGVVIIAMLLLYGRGSRVR